MPSSRAIGIRWQALALALHANLGVMAQAGRALIRVTDQQEAAMERASPGRRIQGGHHVIHRRAQRKPAALQLGQVRQRDPLVGREVLKMNEPGASEEDAGEGPGRGDGALGTGQDREHPASVTGPGSSPTARAGRTRTPPVAASRRRRKRLTDRSRRHSGPHGSPSNT